MPNHAGQQLSEQVFVEAAQKSEPPVDAGHDITKKDDELLRSVDKKVEQAEAPVKELYDKFQEIQLDRLEDDHELRDLAEEVLR